MHTPDRLECWIDPETHTLAGHIAYTAEIDQYTCTRQGMSLSFSTPEARQFWALLGILLGQLSHATPPHQRGAPL